MESVLIVSSGAAVRTLSKIVGEDFPKWKQSIAVSVKEARSLISDQSFDMIIINCPLSDDESDKEKDFVMHIAECSDSGCIMLCKSEDHEKYDETAKLTGTAIVRKNPLNRQNFISAATLISSLRKRLLGLSENIYADKNAEQMKNISRAKSALMLYLKFSEEQAHRYLEKQAMDLRIPKNEVALRVIKMYEQQKNKYE